MTNDKIENWNKLEYVKYSFWQEALYIDKKVISIVVYLEIKYSLLIYIDIVCNGQFS